MFPGKESQKTSSSIEKYKESYVSYTRESSKVLRQLAFGEGALFWFFANHACPMQNVAEIGLGILVMYFIVDSLQYIVGARKFYEKWHCLKDWEEKGVNVDKTTIEANDHLADGTDICFVIKIIVLIFASVVLISVFICSFSDDASCSQRVPSCAKTLSTNINENNRSTTSTILLSCNSSSPPTTEAMQK